MLAPAYSLIEPPWFEDPNYSRNPDEYSTTQSYAGAKTSVYMFTRKLAKDLEGLYDSTTKQATHEKLVF